MTPQYQSVRTRGGQNGDCFRACIASLLDLPLRGVPHFFEHEGENDEVSEATMIALQVWFASRGLYHIQVGYVTVLSTLLAGAGVGLPGLHYTVTGRTRDGRIHTVIAHGTKIVHDPATTDLSDPVPRPLSDGTYRIGFIGKLV